MATTFDSIYGVDNYTGPSIDADGNLVAFEIAAQQVYVKNMQSGAVTLVSQTAAGVESGGQLEAISSDGSSVSFASAESNLAPGVQQGVSEVYVKNLQTGGLALASQTSAGIIADNDSYGGALSANGEIVSFISSADNLGLGVTAGGAGVYVKNELTGALTLVSQSSAGGVGDGASIAASSISADGDVVAFDSNATNLGSASGAQEIYVKTISTGALTIASETSDGTIANGTSSSASISADGTEVAFASDATNLSPNATSGSNEIYVKNLLTGALMLVSSDGVALEGDSSQPILSADGNYVAFSLTDGGSTQVWIKNLQTGALSPVSQSTWNTMGAPLISFSQIGAGSGQVFSADDKQLVFNATWTSDLDHFITTTSGVTRATTASPTVAFDPIGDDGIVNAAELASPVTFSGESNAIGGTVQISLDGSGPPIGTATVASNGQWTLTADVSGLSEGAHTETATVSDSYLPPTTSSHIFQVDTTPPTVAFAPGVTFEGAHWATLTGAVSDPLSAVTGVEIFENGTDLGAATLDGGGSWTFTDTQLPFGDYDFSAVATDAIGNASAQTSSAFSLQTGIRGQPYVDYEADFDNSGDLTGEYFTKRYGALYLADTVTNLPNGNIDIDYSAGTYFNTQNFYNQDDLYGPQYEVLKVETLYNDDGTTSVTGFANGVVLKSVHDDIMTGGGSRETFSFAPHFGQDEIADFQVHGPGHDFISLSTQDFASVGQVLNHTWNVNGNAVIHIGLHQTITLENVDAAQLRAHPQDFKLHG